jgi:uncharacterized MnhB-related membrane protein
MTEIFTLIVLIVLIAAAVLVAALPNLLASVIVFAVYSFVMAVLWQQLAAPDLAITEAAVGAGITTVLLILTLKRVGGAKK